MPAFFQCVGSVEKIGAPFGVEGNRIGDGLPVTAGIVNIECAGKVFKVNGSSIITTLALCAVIDHAIHSGNSVDHFLGDIISVILISRTPFIFRSAP